MNPKAKQTTNTGRKLGLIVTLLLIKKGFMVQERYHEYFKGKPSRN